MSYGIKVTKQNGASIIDSRFASYRFLGRYRTDIGPGSMPSLTDPKYPPIIFIRPIDFQDVAGYPQPITWNSTTQQWNYPLVSAHTLVCSPNTLTNLPGGVHFFCYVFGVLDGVDNWGMITSNGTASFNISTTPPLMVKRKLKIDDNTHPSGTPAVSYSNSGRIVSLGQASNGGKSWAWLAAPSWVSGKDLFSGIFGAGKVRSIRIPITGSNYNFSMWSYFTPFIYYDGSNNGYASSHSGVWQGGTTPENEPRPNPFDVWIIDCSFYDPFVN